MTELLDRLVDQMYREAYPDPLEVDLERRTYVPPEEFADVDEARLAEGRARLEELTAIMHPTAPS